MQLLHFPKVLQSNYRFAENFLRIKKHIYKIIIFYCSKDKNTDDDKKKAFTCKHVDFTEISLNCDSKF